MSHLMVFILIFVDYTLGDGTHTTSEGLCVTLQSCRILYGCNDYTQRPRLIATLYFISFTPSTTMVLITGVNTDVQ